MKKKIVPSFVVYIPKVICVHIEYLTSTNLLQGAQAPDVHSYKETGPGIGTVGRKNKFGIVLVEDYWR